ncbi:transmembrane protein 100-like [Eublepharis macularius]|uniref:Transmembrane protein 100-like n=1 Tax=Eublepharis macularius TaxID=481883 RepID=A0AA97K745_EUBMA|nr:transmembrane protein 100-like [Eublepharis macularius]
MSYDIVTVNMEREEVCLPRLDPRLLSTTTGGTEASWQDCLLPFGLVLGVIGLAATSVACAHDPPGSVLAIIGFTLLGVGVLGMATSCWCRRYRRRKREWDGSWSVLVGDTQAKKPIV